MLPRTFHGPLMSLGVPIPIAIQSIVRMSHPHRGQSLVSPTALAKRRIE